MMNANDLKKGLAQFFGTCHYYLVPIHPFKFTDGVKFLAENAGCYWLLDAIASYHRKEPFQIWNLNVDLDKHTAVLTMKEDTNEPVLVEQEFSYTDFPLENISLWLIEGILLLPNEY